MGEDKELIEYLAWSYERYERPDDAARLRDGGPMHIADYRALAAMRRAIEGERERCAKLVEGDAYEGRYRTWPWWQPDKFNNRGNFENEGIVVRHCDNIAAAIRARVTEGRDSNG